MAAVFLQVRSREFGECGEFRGSKELVKLEECNSDIHLIPKWRPINYSFVCMFISPLCLIFTSKFYCVSYMLTRHQGLINMQTKE